MHLLVNIHRADAVEAAASALSWMKERGVAAGADPESAGLLGVPSLSSHDFAKCDLAVSFGGDGTLIRAA